jgi:tetratricopeptide (TPR) repeat protein
MRPIMSTPIGKDAAEALLDRIEASLGRGQIKDAERLSRGFVSQYPARFEGLVLLGRALQKQGQLRAALEAALAARRLSQGHPAAELLTIECLLQLGECEPALAALSQLRLRAHGHSRLLQDVAQIYTHLNRHQEAEQCYAQAAALTPEDPGTLYNWSTALTGLGRLEAAEQCLDRVIELAPLDFDAYYNRSTLRRQTSERNHIAALEACQRAAGANPAARVPLGYAMAKELEDLGEYAKSFVALRSAADTRRRALSYQVEADTDGMADIERCFDARYIARPGAGHTDSRAVFIVGLPRSGTTLIDRILSSHSAIESRGESSDLGTTVMGMASPSRSKRELIERTARLEPADVGREYCARLPRAARAHIIDKTPVNFLYVGLIAKALPQARIIHVRRHAMDVCYAMYKTLFRMAYPFSYSLDDLGRYYLAYQRLMSHWHKLLGSRLIEVDYEAIVAHQEAETRALLQRCGWQWEPACLEFHRNEGPSLTASAAQVRQPIYSSSVGLWRRYASELEPLASRLRRAGVAVD